MNMYLVTWSINIPADSPKDAAEEARRIQLDADSIATVFEVDSGDNLQHETFIVDLGEIR